MIHENVLYLSLFMMSGILLCFAYVALNASQTDDDYEAITTGSYRLRGRFFGVLLLVGVIIAIASTRNLPYGAQAGTAKQIDVIGKQWYWEISDSTAKAKQAIQFNVTSGDVNHGLGIYDKDLRLLAQVQAMPDYTNTLSFTFEKPGEYKLMCMEYCGLVHHSMISSFTVTEEE